MTIVHVDSRYLGDWDQNNRAIRSDHRKCGKENRNCGTAAACYSASLKALLAAANMSSRVRLPKPRLRE